jgi:hypothetical protein
MKVIKLKNLILDSPNTLTISGIFECFDRLYLRKFFCEIYAIPK